MSQSSFFSSFLVKSRHLSMAVEITSNDGNVATHYQLYGMKFSIDHSGAKISATLMKKFIGQDGEETCRAKERGMIF